MRLFSRISRNNQHERERIYRLSHVKGIQALCTDRSRPRYFSSSRSEFRKRNAFRRRYTHTKLGQRKGNPVVCQLLSKWRANRKANGSNAYRSTDIFTQMLKGKSFCRCCCRNRGKRPGKVKTISPQLGMVTSPCPVERNFLGGDVLVLLHPIRLGGTIYLFRYKSIGEECGAAFTLFK